MIRPLTPQKPQRATVSTDTKPHSLAKPDQPGSSQDPRRYPGTALGGMLVLGVLLGLLFAGIISSLVGGGSSTTTTPTPSASGAIASQQAEDQQTQQRADQLRANQAPESRDVRILGCGSDAAGYASASVLITNSTSTRSTYYVRVLFTSAGDGHIISDDVASVKRLPPGATAPVQTVNAVDAAPGDRVLCQLGSVSRF